MELEKLKQIIAQVLGVDADLITEDTSFVDDLGADSLDLYQIVMGLEEAYDIEIDADTVDGIQTVRGAVEAVKRITL